METIASALVTAGYICLCVLLFSVSIAIHEFGHFLVALKLGYKVERFSIGFGPAIWKRRWRGVEYRVSWIPLGGYVLIPDVDPEGMKKLEGGEESAGGREPAAAGPGMPPWKDLLVALAGPAMNLVLAAVLAVVLAAAPGARFGKSPAVIGGVYVDSAADRGGLMEGDEVLSVDGRRVESWSDMTTEVQFAAGREVDFVVRRGGKDVSLKVRPETKENGIAYIGAVSKSDDAGLYAMWMPVRNPLSQLAWDAGAVFRALKGLVTPKEMKATGKALGGPVLMAKGTYNTIRSDVWDGLGFLRFLNTNLAVMNLLPIPVLDGGLILFSLLAILFRRRIPEKVTNALSTAFTYILVGAMLLLVVRDFWRIGAGDFSKRVEFGELRDAAHGDGPGQEPGGGEAPDAP